MSAKVVWIVGDWLHDSFAEPLAWLQARANCRLFLDVAAVRTSISAGVTGADPFAVILAQSRPGQISQSEIEWLYAIAPLARLVGLVGPWCEGELRSGRPWIGVSRVAWRDWRSRLPRELGLNHWATAPEIRLPRIASETDRLQQSGASLARRCHFSGNAELLTSSRTTFQMWQDALRAFGVRSGCPAFEGAEVLAGDVQLIDGWENVPASAPLVGCPPRVLALPFPRPDDLARAATKGVRAILPQPCLLADLAAALADVLPASARPLCGSAA